MNRELTPEFYSSVIQNSHDIITIIDHAVTYKYISNSVEQHLGFKPLELIGRNALHHIHAEDLPHVLQALEAINYTKQLKAKPFRYLHQNGSWRWLGCVITNMLDNPAVNGIVTNSRDITEEIESAALRDKSRAYYEALFFNHPDLVFTLNGAGLIEASNTSVSRLSGYSMEEAIGKHFTYFIAPSHLEETLLAFRKVITGGAHTFETKILNKNQQVLDINVTLVPVLVDNRVTAVHCIAKDITQLKLSEKLLQEQTAQLNNILGSITEAFFALDREWCFTYANSTFARYFDKPSSKLVGLNIWQKAPNLVNSLFYDKCLQVMASGVAQEFEEYIEPLQATTHYKIYSFEDGIAVCFTDITARKAAQAELNKLSLVASKTTNGVVITDKKGKVEWVNNSFIQFTGYNLDELLHQDPIAVLQGPETSKEDIKNIRKLLSLAIPISEELLTYKKNGEKAWTAADITPILNDAGEVEKFIAIYTDISDRKFAEEKLLQMNENLVRHNHDLQQFAYIVSHNLRAPVANMIGLTKILPKLNTAEPNYTKALSSLDKSALRLNAVICDLTEILSVKGPEGKGATEPVELLNLSKEIKQCLLDTTSARRETIELDIAAGLVLPAKRAYLYSIIHNLLLNAIKYCSEERPLRVLLKVEQTPEGTILQVQDNGLGMDMKTVGPHIFKLYRRFHAHTEGRGLGLYLVKTQVEAMGGTINVESTLGQGTTFRIFFRNTQYT